MHALLLSTFTVFLAEMGDKTQLLSMLLAARYRAPLHIMAGILVATTLNHALSGIVGAWLGTSLSPQMMAYVAGAIFIAVAVWTLKADRLDHPPEMKSSHAFVISTVVFFFAEMGDKTQVATILLAAQYKPLIAVIAGTTIGMMLANLPAVLLGDKLLKKIPMHWLRYTAATLFALLGIAALTSAT